MLKFKGCEHFRQRLVLSCLSGRPMRIDDIRSDDENPGLKGFEASMLRLVEKVTNGCMVEINETGTSLRFRPGMLTAGSGLAHDCGRDRAISYFMEPLILLCMLAKKPLEITLRGVTNSPADISSDVFRAVALDIFAACGVAATMAVKRRAVGPDGGGCVVLTVQNMPHVERPLRLVDEGRVRRVRGVAWTCRMAPAFTSQLLTSAKGVLLKLLPDVMIFTDTTSAPHLSQGYGISLIAETTTKRFISAERCISGAELHRCREAQIVPEDVGVQAAHMLLDEVSRGGVTDGTHQGLLLTLAAMGPAEVNKVRLGALTTHAIKTLRHLKDFLGISFDIKPDTDSSTILLSCVGSGLKNLARKVQ